MAAVLSYVQHSDSLLVHVLGSSYTVDDAMFYAASLVGVLATGVSPRTRAARIPLLGTSSHTPSSPAPLLSAARNPPLEPSPRRHC